MLANCFLNMYTIKCKYSQYLEDLIYNNTPEIFKIEIKVPDYYLNVVRSKMKNNLIIE